MDGRDSGTTLPPQGAGQAAPDAPAPEFAQGLRYRRDIDGLRTIAVLSVLLFHVDSSIVTGGFVGVDIFFVISGYLITGIIQREVVAGDFSILRFYERRMRRIFPALFAMMAAVLVAGLLIFMPGELRDLGSSFIATTAFVSNILFWMQTDYFAGPVEFKPLLHTWSLAVEEQFYLLIPALMYFAHRWRPAAVKPLMVAITLLSLAASCAWVWIDASGNYYFPHTRAWELLLGSLVALGVVPRIASDRGNSLAAIVGLVLVLAPIFLLTEKSVFPAWNAIAPCVGVALLILTGAGRRTPVTALLGLAPMVWIGLISYSLYLVHWPLIVFTKYQLMRELLPVEKAGLVVVMIALAWLSWRFVEYPFRSAQRVSRRAIFILGIGASLVAILIGTGLYATKGLPQRFGNVRIEKRDEGRSQLAQDCFLREGWQAWKGDKCTLTPGHGGSTILFWGDSHAYQYAAPLQSRRDAIKGRVILYGSAGCPPILGVDFPRRPFCRANNDHVWAVLKERGIEKVVLSGYWQYIFDDNDLPPEAMAETVRKLQQAGLKVAIIGDNPDYPFANPDSLAIRLAKRETPEAPYYMAMRNRMDFNRRMQAAAKPDLFFDPQARLCHGAECLVFEKGHLLMKDNGHLSVYGAGKLLDDMGVIFD